MSPFAEFPLLTIFMLIVLVLVLASVFSPRKPPGLPPPRNGMGPGMGPTPGAAKRSCPSCNAEHPPYAAYCRRCGGRL